MNVEKLIRDVKALPKNIGNKGNSIFERLGVNHYENVSSKMMEYIFSSDEQSQIDNLGIQALLEEAQIPYVHAPRVLEVLSEVSANSNKHDYSGRIDLVVHLPECSLVIENKIDHILNNPFEVYKAFAKKEYTKSKGRSGNNYFLLMGIKKPKNIPKNFIFVSHEQFCKNLKLKLIDYYQDKTKEHTYYFIQDYIEAVIQMTNVKADESKKSFFKMVTEHYAQLDEIQNRKNELFDVSKKIIEEIIELSNYYEQYFSSKIQRNNTDEWRFKGSYIETTGIKKILNGSEVFLNLNVQACGITLNISILNNRTKYYYTQDEILNTLEGVRLISNYKKNEQIFDYELTVEQWSHEELDSKVIAKKIDSYITKIEQLELSK